MIPLKKKVCYKCLDRVIFPTNCHMTCKDYLEQREILNEKKSLAKKENDIYSYTAEAATKRKRFLQNKER